MSAIPRVDLTTRFGYAIAYAFHLHAGQRRKGGDVPYFAHLLAVAATVLDHGGSEDAAIAAVLHDAVEDQGGAATLAEIQRRYGKPVSSMVDVLSDTMVDPKPAWHARKVAYIGRIAVADAATKLVCAADKLHNLRCTVADVRRTGPSAMLKFSAPPADTVAYYDACIAAVRRDVPKPLVDELDWTLAALKTLLALPLRRWEIGETIR